MHRFTKVFAVLSVLFVTACAQGVQPQFDTGQMIEDLRVISSDEMEGRKTGTEGNRKAREYLVQRFEEEGAQPFRGAFIHEFNFVNRNDVEMTGLNVVGEIPGKSDSVIVITAHYDHLGMRDSLIYNGADDDASGTAALIAYIDYFSQVQPSHTLVFAAFDAEEMGLKGAKAFVEDSVFLEKVVMNINLDMISQNDNNELYASGTYHYPGLKPVLENIETREINLLFGHDRPEQEHDDWTFASDHAAFHEKGKKYIYFGVEDHEHYHQPSDEFDTIPQEFYKKAAKVILNAIKAFDEM